MALIEHLTPAHYKVMRMGIQQDDGGIVALYDVQILNADGRLLDTIHPSSGMTAQERAAIVGIYQADKAAFEAATGLTEWVEPEP